AASQCPALKAHGFSLEIRPVADVLAGLRPATPEPADHSRYLFAFYRDEMEDDEERQAAFRQWAPYIERLHARGRGAGAEALAPSGSATLLRLRDGRIVLTDGAFTEQRWQLAGYCIVWAGEMDEAVDLACECPGLGQHAIEVRAIRRQGG